MNAEPYLCLAGTEIINGTRSLVYLARGLAGSRFQVPRSSYSPDAGYADEYADVYGPDGPFSETVECTCDALNDGTDFVSPAADPAPWYQDGRPESGEFLGVITDVLNVGNPPLRPVVGLAHGGLVGPLYRRARVIAVHGQMFATSARGMDWGERWLTEALTGSACEGCGGDDAEILPACPSGAIDPALRTLLDVGLVDGPIFTPMEGIPGCLTQEVSFQLAAGNPYLHRSLTTASTTVYAGQTFAYAIETDEWGGDAGVSVTLEALTNLTDVVVRAAPLTDIDDCGDADLNPCVEYRIASVPGGHILSIDGRRRTVTEFNASSKVWESGYRRLDFDGPFDWIEVPPCSLMCVTVTVGGGTADAEVGWALREI